MKWIKTAMALLASASLLQADVPHKVAIQGYLENSDFRPYEGVAQFKFALINRDASVVYWKNDNTFPAAGDDPEPDTAVIKEVEHGLYSIVLGSSGMAEIDPDSLPEKNLYLRTWFRNPVDSTSEFILESPDMRIVSVPYALKVADGSITSDSIAVGSVTTYKIAPDAVTSDRLDDNIDLGNAGLAGTGSVSSGSLILRNGNLSTAAPSDGVSLYGTEGKIKARGEVISGDAFVLRKLPSTLFGASESFDRAKLAIRDSGANLRFRDEEGLDTALVGSATPNGGQLKLYSRNDSAFAGITAVEGFIAMASHTGDHSGAYMALTSGNGTRTIIADGQDDNGGGRITLRREDEGDPVAVIKLVAKDDDGNARVTTEVLEITGGADLSEQFDIHGPGEAVEPGMVVCIDPRRPGELRVSDTPCDPTVAGIISGAGGVNPGMLMGQTGSIADGQHPVALTGRVYCQVDADEGGPVQPGNLLTTASTPGHAMKANPTQASGAVIGKAMTSLESGRGLVLVLVSLQ